MPFRIVFMFVILLAVVACSRQYAVTLNEQTVYDPRNRLGDIRVVDAQLQACINLAIEQQELEMAESLTVLSCAGMDIRTLEGIEGLVNLQFLDISGNQLTRLDALRGSHRLRAITATGNPLTDIAPLLDLPSLATVNLSGSDIIPCEQLDALAEKLSANLTRPDNCANQE